MNLERTKQLLQRHHEQLLKDLEKLFTIETVAEAIAADDNLTEPLEDKLIQKNKELRKEIFDDFDAQHTYDTLTELAEEGVITLNDKYMESLKKRIS